MLLICGLMLLLLQTAKCLERNCGFIESDQICYAALGHKLNLLMVLDSSKYDLMIQKRMNNNQDDPVCRVKYGSMRQCDLFNNRPEVTVINGTVIINPVIRTDSGNYTVRLSGISGSETSRDLQVIVEAPIGSVEMSLLCSSNRVMRASCSSDGDQLLYSWTLNGQTLIGESSSIELNERTDGHLTCRVKNNINDGQKTVRVKHCSETTAAPVASSFTSNCDMSSGETGGNMRDLFCFLFHCFQLVVLLGLFIGFHIYMRLCRKHTSGKKHEDQKLRMRRLREQHDTAEDSQDQQQI